MSWKAVLAGVTATIVAALGASPAMAAQAHRPTPVPFGFVGMDVPPPVWPNDGFDPGPQLDKMVTSGVDSVRAVLNWAAAQPYAGWSEVPPGQGGQFADVGGIPTDFTAIDALVAQTAQRGLTLLPVVLNAPSWDGVTFHDGQLVIPRRPGPYAAFVKALVLRYGRNGSFWRDNPHIPRVPVEMWEIWNEPDVYSFWPKTDTPFWYRSYIPVLRAAHAAIKQADPKAKVVLGGLSNFSWTDLRRILRHGGRNLFDVADIHAFTKTPQGVITILGFARQVLNSAGLTHTPIVAGEISWPTSQGKDPIRFGLDIGTTKAGQASRIAEVLPMLARDRGRLNLAGFDYYAWVSLDRGADVFDFAGLFHFDPSNNQFTAKPAAAVFQRDALMLEGCRSKGTVATACLH